MITIKLIGGAKKSFSTDQIELDLDNITIEDLLEKLLDIKPKNTATLDTNNILIAVNGADSSAMDGRMTRINNNDVISIIPIIHGGSNKKIMITVGKKSIQILEIKGNEKIDVSFLDDLRKEFPNIKLQGISSNFILNLNHLTKILTISLVSDKENILLSNKIETDILLRFAATKQISDAIYFAGIKPKKNFILIAIGNKIILNNLHQKLNPLTTEIFSKDNSLFLKKHFQITKRHLDSVYSKNPLEDILIEKGAVLI
ncbi:MAG: KEOPS complex subunit Cgi121 [Nitrosopumilus sp.]|nr:KEOPS complex subunit Cgi121 [Nitrosopumilus sp.]MDH3384772.1 KEOPS complex subunit Cgi121 [Nitrosopumilus sp.]